MWRAASSARRQSSILSASETANGSRSTGVAYEPEAGSTGARLRPFRDGVARANPVARAAASRAPDSSSRLEQAKPQAPSDEHPDADALALRVGERLYPPVLRRHLLAALNDGPRIRVFSPRCEGRLDRLLADLAHEGQP